MTTRYDILIEANDKASKNIKAINVALKKTDTNATKAAKAVGKMSGNLAKASLKVATGGMKGLAAATVAATAAFVVFGTKSINALDELGKLSSKLGVSTKFLSEYGAVADKAGLSQTQFTTGVQRFLRRLGEAQQGTGELLKPLKAMGIAIKDSNGNFRGGTEVFQDYIKSLGGMANAQQALAFATKGFDTEGVAFINIAKLGTEQINKFKQAARDAGLVVDDKLIKAAEDAKDAISGITDIAKGFGLQFFGNLAKPLQTFADDLKNKINEAVKGAGGMEAFSKALASKFLSAAADTLEAFTKLFEGFANTMRILGNIVKIMLTKIPASLTGGKQYAIFEKGQKSVEDYKKELEAAIKVRDELAAKDEAYSKDRKWWQGAGMRDNPVIEQGPGGMLVNKLSGAKITVSRLQEKIAELNNTEFLNLGYEKVDLFSGSIGNAILKMREMAAEMAKPMTLPPRIPGDHHPDSPKAKTKNTVAMEVAAIDMLISKNKALMPQQAQLIARYEGLRVKIGEFKIALADGTSATDEQKKALNELLQSATDEKNTLHSRIKMGETVNAVYEASATALQTLKTKETELESAISQTVNTMKDERFATDDRKALLIALKAELEANKIAQDKLTGEYKEAAKPMETLAEFMAKITEQGKQATNASYNLQTAINIMTADIIAGRGNVIELAAALEILNGMLAKTDKASKTLSVGEDAKERLDALVKETEYTPRLVAALKELGATREQLLNLGVVDETMQESMIKRLELLREEQNLAPDILKYLQDKYDLTMKEAEALGLVNEASLTATETLFKGMDENLKKFNEIEATLNNADALEGLAAKYGTSTAKIIAFLEEAQGRIQIFKDETVTIAGIISDTWDQMGKNMAAGIAQGIMKGEGLFNSFSGFLKNFANQVITQIIQKMLVQPMINQMTQFGSSLMGGLGGGGMSGGGNGIAGLISSGLKYFAGGFAEGGNIPGGKFGIVGEQGPEFINGPARITPMNNDINSSEGLTVNFNINAISTSDGTSFILEHKKEITGVIQNAYNKRGRQGIY
jgi:hypothetical protein